MIFTILEEMRADKATIKATLSTEQATKDGDSLVLPEDVVFQFTQFADNQVDSTAREGTPTSPMRKHT